jgi:hypothetical protein
VAECAFGVEISEDRSRCSVAKSYRTGDRVTAEPPALAPAFLGERWMADDPVDVALDPKSQAATLIGDLAAMGVLVTRMTVEDVVVAHGRFMDLVATKGLRHLDQPELTAAVRGAQTRPLAGAKAWERRVVTDQSPLTACTFAVWAFLRWEELATPGVYAI